MSRLTKDKGYDTARQARRTSRSEGKVGLHRRPWQLQLIRQASLMYVAPSAHEPGLIDARGSFSFSSCACTVLSDGNDRLLTN